MDGGSSRVNLCAISHNDKRPIKDLLHSPWQGCCGRGRGWEQGRSHLPKNDMLLGLSQTKFEYSKAKFSYGNWPILVIIYLLFDIEDQNSANFIPIARSENFIPDLKIYAVMLQKVKHL